MSAAAHGAPGKTLPGDFVFFNGLTGVNRFKQVFGETSLLKVLVRETAGFLLF